MSDGFDVDEEFRKLEAYEFNEVRRNSEIQRLIQTSVGAYKEFKFNDITLRVRPAIPRDMRRMVAKLKQIATGNVHEEDEEVLLDRSETIFYKFLARMCLDSPFDLPEAWEYIDEQTGMVPMIAVQVIELAAGDEKRVAEFRPVR